MSNIVQQNENRDHVHPAIGMQLARCRELDSHLYVELSDLATHTSLLFVKIKLDVKLNFNFSSNANTISLT